MPDVVPFQAPADTVTGHCAVALTGGRFVAIAGVQQADGPWTIGLPAAGGDSIGVVLRDGAIGDRVPVQCEGIVPVVAGVALVAGQMVQTDAAGAAILLAAGQKLGRVLTDTALGALAPIKLL